MAIATKSRSTSINFSALPHLRIHGGIDGISSTQKSKPVRTGYHSRDFVLPLTSGLSHFDCALTIADDRRPSTEGPPCIKWRR